LGAVVYMAFLLSAMQTRTSVALIGISIKLT